MLTKDTIHAHTKYLDETAVLNFGSYVDGALALQLFSKQGEPLMTATTCLVEYNYTPPAGAIVVKDYSENEGILQCLISEGVIEATPLKIHAENLKRGEDEWTTRWTVHKLTPAALTLAREQGYRG